MALMTTGQVDEALEHFREALRLAPDFLPSLNGIARILATHPDPNLRDAAQAITFAERAAEITGHRNATVLETLASAYAAAGQFDKAAATAQEALELAVAAKDDGLAERLRRQMELYRQAKP